MEERRRSGGGTRSQDQEDGRGETWEEGVGEGFKSGGAGLGPSDDVLRRAVHSLLRRTILETGYVGPYLPFLELQQLCEP